MAVWRTALPLISIIAFIIFEDLIVVPSCVISEIGVSHESVGTTKLKAMIVSDLLLKGSDAGMIDIIFRNILFSRFFRKSYEKLEPDMLVVLGDIAAKMPEIGKSDWPAVLRQFHRVIGPLGGIPLVVGLGERDVGDCCELDEEFVGKIASDLPGLDRTGSASFSFENISFFLINSVALLCNKNSLRFGVEKLIETESFDLRSQLKDSIIRSCESDEIKKLTDGFPPLKNYPPPGSGPVLLLHFPLSSAAERDSDFGENFQRCELKVTRHADRRDILEAPSMLMQTLPVNETEYILQSLRPRLIFSAHRHHFDICNHYDGTLEVVVPAMTWALGGRPSFVFATFGENNTTVRHCSFVGEMHVLLGYLSILLLIVVTIISRGSYSRSFF